MCLIRRIEDPPFASHQLREPCMRSPEVHVQRRHCAFRANEDPWVRQSHKRRQQRKPVEEIARKTIVISEFRKVQEQLPIVADVVWKALPIVMENPVNVLAEWHLPRIAMPVLLASVFVNEDWPCPILGFEEF